MDLTLYYIKNSIEICEHAIEKLHKTLSLTETMELELNQQSEECLNRLDLLNERMANVNFLFNKVIRAYKSTDYLNEM